MLNKSLINFVFFYCCTLSFGFLQLIINYSIAEARSLLGLRPYWSRRQAHMRLVSICKMYCEFQYVINGLMKAILFGQAMILALGTFGFLYRRGLALPSMFRFAGLSFPFFIISRAKI